MGCAGLCLRAVLSSQQFSCLHPGLLLWDGDLGPNLVCVVLPAQHEGTNSPRAQSTTPAARRDGSGAARAQVMMFSLL